MKAFLVKNKVTDKDKEVELLFRRYNKDLDFQITFEEFMKELVSSDAEA